MELSKMTDLEIAELSGQLYQQFMQTQGNLIAVNSEIKRRKDLVKPLIVPNEVKE
jgi:hypothetical protein